MKGTRSKGPVVRERREGGLGLSRETGERRLAGLERGQMDSIRRAKRFTPRPGTAFLHLRLCAPPSSDSSSSSMTFDFHNQLELLSLAPHGLPCGGPLHCERRTLHRSPPPRLCASSAPSESGRSAWPDRPALARTTSILRLRSSSCSCFPTTTFLFQLSSTCAPDPALAHTRHSLDNGRSHSKSCQSVAQALKTPPSARRTCFLRPAQRSKQPNWLPQQR